MQTETLIASLRISARTGLYEVTENRITYIFDFDMMINLQSYIAEADAKQHTDLINCWYKSLPLRRRIHVYVLMPGLRNNHQNGIL
jgi:hypothetical protein